MKVKWWHFIILKLIVVFVTMAWIYFFPTEIENDFARSLVGFGILWAIVEIKKKNKEEE